MTRILSILAVCACTTTPADTPAPTPPAAEPPPPSQPLAGVQVHLTIDDIPYMSERDTPMRLSGPEVLALNQQIIDALAQRKVTASVFVVCNRLRPDDGTLEAWEAAGHAVGNHSNTHAPLNRMEADAWLADVRTCHEVMASRLKSSPTWFRYPYLGYGKGADKRDAATAGLTEMGYRSAPVTVATSEWMHGFAYRRALRAGDGKRQAAIAIDFQQHMDAALAEGVAMATEVPSRPVPQTVLVHANELVANEIGPLIDRWRSLGATFVDLDGAMNDPVFSQTNHYEGGGGLSWLYRIRTDEDPQRNYWFGDEEQRVIAAFGPMPVNGEE